MRVADDVRIYFEGIRRGGCWTALVCAWCGAGRTHANFSEDYPAGPGGLIGGAYLAPVLRNYFGDLGIYLVLVAAGVFACLLIEQNATEAALALFGRMLVNVGAHAGNWALGKAQNAMPMNQPRPILATTSGTGGVGVARAALPSAARGVTERPPTAVALPVPPRSDRLRGERNDVDVFGSASRKPRSAKWRSRNPPRNAPPNRNWKMKC